MSTERLYINWNYAARVQEDQKATKEALELLTTAYPRDFAARNNLGVYYNNNGQFEEALKEYQAATDIAPDEPGPISNAAYVLFALGRLDEGSAQVDRALALRPDGNLALARWIGARIAGHAKASQFEDVARKLAGPDQVSLAEASIAAWEGRFKDFGRIEADVAARARAAGNDDLARGVATGERITRALYLQGREIDALKSAAAKATDLPIQAQYAAALAVLGDVSLGRSILPRVSKDPETASSGTESVLRAYVAAKDGKTDEAIADLQKAIVQNPRAQELHFMIADLQRKIRTG